METAETDAKGKIWTNLEKKRNARDKEATGQIGNDHAADIRSAMQVQHFP
jgi:hypothetical protein